MTRFNLRRTFIAGLIILIPIVLTVKTLWWLFTTVDGFARPLVERWAGRPIPGVGFALTIALVLLTGLLLSGGPLRRLFEGFEEAFESVPFVGTFYSTVKKVLVGFGGDGSTKAFQRFVLARLPGRTTPGFLTGSFDLSRSDGRIEPLCTVYVPTNHLYVGDVVVLPASDVIETDLTVEDGISLILSAGAAVPPTLREARRDDPGVESAAG